MARRIIVVVLSALVGLVLSLAGETAFGLSPGIWIPIGLAVGCLIVVSEYAVRTLPLGTVVGGVIGLIAGCLLTGLVAVMGISLFRVEPSAMKVVGMVLVLGLPYWGMLLGARFGKPQRVEAVRPSEPTVMSESIDKILDTSVIIDGRISDLCETGFLEGAFLVPQFILHELQHIADSSDSLKRARGRRGLDVLNKIQKMVDIDVRIIDEDFPQVNEVDSKIVLLAKQIGAKVITNDLNLNKVAELQGVRVLNINELCHALRPVVLPGEMIRVFVLKEGKEAGQGVAYLDDGTMIVVDNARKCIGRTVDVVVTSVLQTTAGRMIFTRLREETEKVEFQVAHG